MTQTGRRTAVAPVSRVATVLTAASLVLFGCAVPDEADGVAATVIRVVDGDTIVVSLDGEERRVRLLNVDAPESVRPDWPVECLGPEAADHLRTLLPAGLDVTLRYDVERTDNFGRDLAAVFVDERLVNAELARAGLAEALLIPPNDAYYDEVATAEREARRLGAGLHDPDLDCG